MENIVNLYKELSNKIIELLKEEEIDNDKIDNYFNERQKLIDDLNKENEIDEFRRIYNVDLVEIDKEIKVKLQEHILYTKKEIIDYRKNQKANFAYSTINKLNLNIFSKKV